MFYMIYSEDVANSLDKRLATRPAHLARLEQLKTEGRLLLAGPTPAIDSADRGPAGFSGSQVVAELASRDEALHCADADPYMPAGVYHRSTVNQLNKVLP